MATTDRALETPSPLRARGSPGPFEALRRSWQRWWFAYAMLAPVMCVMGLLVFWPLVKGVMLSFTNADRYSIGGENIPSTYTYNWGSNYADIITSGDFRRVLLWTVIWTFVCTFFHFTIGLGLAVALNRTLKFRGIYRMLLMVPWAVPSFISAFSWRFLFNNPYGFFDQALKYVGVHDPPAWLGDPTWAKVAVIMVNVWLGIPFMMVALLGGLQAMDADLIEAASIDGAPAWRRFWDITLPSLRPVAATVILLGIIWTFNLFAVIFLVTQGGPDVSTQILSTFAYREAFDLQFYGRAATYGVIILSILLVFGSFYRRLVTRLGEESWA